MTDAGLKTRAVGICLACLAYMAIATGVAQAEKGAQWMVNGKAVTESLLPSLEITSLEGGETILTRAAGVKIEKRCSGYELIGIKLEVEGKAGTGAKVKFTGCELILNGVPSAACTPHTPGDPPGTLTSTAGKGLLVLHEGEGIVRVEPLSGELFMIIETSEECAIGEEIPVIGKFTIKDCQRELTTEKVLHLVEEGPLTEAWIFSKTAEHRLTFDGSAVGGLAGVHKGLKVSGLPG